jgi:hypothetical protein
LFTKDTLLDIRESDRVGSACTARMTSSSAYSIASVRAVLSTPRVSWISQSGEPSKPTRMPWLPKSRGVIMGDDVDDGEMVVEPSEGVSKIPNSATLGREARVERLERSDMLISW